MTHDDIIALVHRMVEQAGQLRLSSIGDTALCAEMVEQGLARQRGAWLTLTGNGWHTGSANWPSWVLETIDMLVGKILETDGGTVKMDDLSRSAGLLENPEDAERAHVAWSIIVHACLACFDQVTCSVLPDWRTEGTFRLAMRGYDPKFWAAALAAPAWELLPIKETTP